MRDRKICAGFAGALKRHFEQTFRSVRHRNFAFYCGGALTSLCGSWMQIVVLGWLAYQLTGSSVILGTVAFANLVPTIILSLAGGWVAGRANRKHILLCTQSLAMMQALTLLYLTATGQVQVWHIIVVSAALGVLVAFELPARFAMIPELVDSEEILNAFSLDSLLFFSSRAAGPAVGALLLGAFGASTCFLVNACTYVVELVTIMLIRYKPAPRQPEATGVSACLRFFKERKEMRRILVLIGFCSLCVVYLPFMPVFAHKLSSSPTVLGILVACSEGGALCASIWLAQQPPKKRLSKAIGFGALLLAVFVAAFCFSPSVLMAALMAFGVGAFWTVVIMGGHGLVQLASSNELRGMVSSIYWMISLGLESLGGLLLGLAGKFVGMSMALTIGGAIIATIGLCYLIARREPEEESSGSEEAH